MDGESERKEEKGYTPDIATDGSKLINRLTIQDLEAIEDVFHVKNAESQTEQSSLTKNQFCDLFALVLNKGTRDEYEDLFEQIDHDKEGLVDWDKLCSHILLECYEKDDRVKTTQVPQWRELKYVYSHHKEVILKIAYLPNTSKYCSISRDGNICFWNTDFKLIRTVQVQADQDDLRQKDLWATSFTIMSNVNKLAVALTSKEIMIYDLNTKSEFNRLYRICNLPATPLCLDYWSNPNSSKQSYLSFGDTSGSVHVFSFLQPSSSLFDRPPQSTATNRDMCTIVDFNNIAQSLDSRVTYFKHSGHSDWARQLQYLPFLESFASTSTTSKDSLILASIDKTRIHMRLSVFSITQGINGFDYNESINAIATAGINNHVCLWNPFVVSKPVGVLRGHMQSVIVVRFIQSRGQLLSLSKDKVLRVWDTHLQVCLQRLSGIFPKGSDMVISMYYDHDRCRLFTSFNQLLTVMVMKVEVKGRIFSHDNPISAVLYNSNLNQVVSVCTGSTMTVWMFDTGQKVKQVANAHGKSEITCLSQDPSETRLITGSTDGALKIWDFNGHCYHTLLADDGNPCEISYALWMKQSLVCVGWEKNVCNFLAQHLNSLYVYPTEWRGKQEHKDDILSAAFSPPHTLATGSYDGDIVLWNTTSEHAFRHLDTSVGGKTDKEALNGTRLSRSGYRPRRASHLLAAMSLSTETQEEKLDVEKASRCRSTSRLSTFTSGTPDDERTAVTSLLYLQNRPQPTSEKSAANLISVSAAGEVLFWNTYTGQQTGRFFPHGRSGIVKIATDPKNCYLVTGNGDGMCKVWEITSYCTDSVAHCVSIPPLMHEFNPHTDVITDLQIVIRFGKTFILTASCDCSIMLHRLNGQLIGVFGQEKHWKLDVLVDDDHLTTDVYSETAPVVSSTHKLENHNEIQVEVASHAVTEEDDKFQYDTHFQTWDNTILGTAYKEKNSEKRERRQPFTLPSISCEKGIARRTFKSLSCSELDSTSCLHKPDFMVYPEKYFSEKDNLDKNDSLPPLPPILDSLAHRHDMKSIFPKYILDMDLKMRTAHTIALGSPGGSTMYHSSMSSPMTQRSSPKMGSGRVSDLCPDKKLNRLDKNLVRKIISSKNRVLDNI